MIKQAKIVVNVIVTTFKMMWDSYLSMEQITNWIQEAVEARKKNKRDSL